MSPVFAVHAQEEEDERQPGQNPCRDDDVRSLVVRHDGHPVRGNMRNGTKRGRETESECVAKKNRRGEVSGMAVASKQARSSAALIHVVGTRPGRKPASIPDVYVLIRRCLYLSCICRTDASIPIPGGMLIESARVDEHKQRPQRVQHSENARKTHDACVQDPARERRDAHGGTTPRVPVAQEGKARAQTFLQPMWREGWVRL